MPTAMFVVAILSLIAASCCVLCIVFDDDDAFEASFVSLLATVIALSILVIVNFGQS